MAVKRIMKCWKVMELKRLSNLVIFIRSKREVLRMIHSGYRIYFTIKKKTFMSVPWGNIWRKSVILNLPVAMATSQPSVFIKQKTVKVVHPRLSTQSNVSSS
jgi:hypothetical protein